MTKSNKLVWGYKFILYIGFMEFVDKKGNKTFVYYDRKGECVAYIKANTIAEADKVLDEILTRLKNDKN